MRTRHRNQRTGQRHQALLAGLLAVATLYHPLPALGHSRAEQDAWMIGWEQRAMTVDFSPEILSELDGFLARHRPTPSPVPPTRPATEYGGTGATVEQWRPLVAAYFPPEAVDTALRIIDCESGGNPDADNPYSTAAGLWQFVALWWEGRWDPYDPEVATQKAAERFAASGWRDWYASRGCWE